MSMNNADVAAMFRHDIFAFRQIAIASRDTEG